MVDERTDGRGLWPLRYTAHERVSVRVQARADVRNVPLRWYWRHREEDAAPRAGYSEVPLIDRQYDGPDPVHLFIDDTNVVKGMTKAAIESSGTAAIEISRAECRRLGVLFNTVDDHDALLDDEETLRVGPFDPANPLFVPRAGDIFMYRKLHWRVIQMEPKKDAVLGATGIVMVWSGTAALLREDANQPVALIEQLVPETPDPIVPRKGKDIKWPG